MAHPAALRAVRTIPYFASLTSQEAELFAAELPVRKFSARDLVFREGEAATGFYFLDAGKARIFHSGPEGREQAFRLVLPGDTFGEVPALDGEPSPANVEVLEPSEVVLIPTKALFALMEHRPQVAVRLLHHLARRLRLFTQLVEQIGQQTVRARLCRYLFQLAREEGAPAAGGILVQRTLTQQDLASLLGSVREVVSRTLKGLEDEGIVEVGRKTILIRNVDALREAV